MNTKLLGTAFHHADSLITGVDFDGISDGIKRRIRHNLNFSYDVLTKELD